MEGSLVVLAALVGVRTAGWEVDDRFFVWVDAGDDERDFAATCFYYLVD